MGTPLGPVKINLGDKIKDQFVVKRKIGEGACGQVYLVNIVDRNGKVSSLKLPIVVLTKVVEPLMRSKDDEILKMEIFVLKKIQKYVSDYWNIGMRIAAAGKLHHRLGLLLQRETHQDSFSLFD
ncbi:unnamed protein product [Strongylus vulgaris]|uniref:Protein kinase domain-containing protein n=1 Tax=Strongylus vulgaris TaxID=40348 RepID=A0A3P7IJ53_STRVU|nr:unnamed protein product [Strongylus vulgaris]